MKNRSEVVPRTTTVSKMDRSNSRILGNQGSKATSVSNNKMANSRIIVNNNVVIPGKATSNIKRKGPHKNIINVNIINRKF